MNVEILTTSSNEAQVFAPQSDFWEGGSSTLIVPIFTGTMTECVGFIAQFN